MSWKREVLIEMEQAPQATGLPLGRPAISTKIYYFNRDQGHDRIVRSFGRLVLRYPTRLEFEYLWNSITF